MPLFAEAIKGPKMLLASTEALPKVSAEEPYTGGILTKIQASDLTQRLRNRRYPKGIVSKAFQRAKRSDRFELLIPKMRPQEDVLRFVSTYHNQWGKMRYLLQQNWRILQADDRIKRVIPAKPVLVSKKAPNLKDVVTKSHFQRPPVKRTTGVRLRGSFPCGDCNICRFMKPTYMFKNPRDGKEYRLDTYINCKGTNVIYGLICPCSFIYIGQTGQQLRKRVQKHLSNITLADRDSKLYCKITSVATHFLKYHRRQAHGITVIGLEQVKGDIRGGSLTKLLLKKESKWIYNLQSVTPTGLNEELLFSGFLGSECDIEVPYPGQYWEPQTEVDWDCLQPMRSWDEILL
ncbi:uncharacterized protein LOC130276998 [Hyla sarda]|uniref:uncharacterized protein LOC130276998 n=1 Tax=Hyla sarda TaxID=327740 RepID=UPI0024C46236|nr:uncharacterized protein LOC130276998 [Hyla sarda]